MNQFELNIIFTYSILIAGIIGWVRFKKLNPAYLPFLYLIWIGIANETISIILLKTKHTNEIPYNIYLLLEMLFITWQFQKWKLFRNKRTFILIIAASVSFWVLESFVFSSITRFNSFFLIASSYVIVLMSIGKINQLAMYEHGSLMKSASFLICLGFVIFFTYSVLVEAFWLYGLSQNHVFADHIYAILIYVNLFTNLIYAVAFLWMPTKPKFILPS